MLASLICSLSQVEGDTAAPLSVPVHLQVYTEAEPCLSHALKLPRARRDESGVDTEEETLLLCVLTVI